MSNKPNPDSSNYNEYIQNLARAIRFLSADMVQRANSGHPGMPLGMADVATVLFHDFLKFSPSNPDWPGRDRFVLSAGHGSALLYSLLYLTGYPDMTVEQLQNFRQLGSKTAGHPEYGHATGIETTTGPLGQGLANAVGMAIAEAHLAAKFGDIVDNYTYVIAGDGCLMEGISYEACALAGHLQLGKLIVLFDDNGITIDGSVSLASNEDIAKRFEAQQWQVINIDGHNPKAISQAIKDAQQDPRPSLITCKTHIGLGAGEKQDTAAAHGAPLGEELLAKMREEQNWSYPAFEVPADILSKWHDIQLRTNEEYKSWQNKFEAQSVETQNSFTKIYNQDLGEEWYQNLENLKKKYINDNIKQATRKSSGEVIAAISPYLDGLVGGSADLTGSNLTYAKSQEILNKNNYAGKYLHYGIREHAMAAVMNGIALYNNGMIPYGGTFLVFSDYCRPGIRLSALMRLGVIYVFTHDSIGLGEDGPTHQPIEHLSALRAIPDLLVFRPADGAETAECWALALANRDKPSILALSRQGLPNLRYNCESENLSAKGGYIAYPENEKLMQNQQNLIVIIATGSEVNISMGAAQNIEEEKQIPVRVVSMPCKELFEMQPISYQQQVIPDNSKRIIVEAGKKDCWGEYLHSSAGKGKFIGMNGFGASAPAGDLFTHFGITVQAIVQAAE